MVTMIIPVVLVRFWRKIRNVRFHTPVLVGDSVQIIGRLISQRRGIYLLEATLSVAKQICVKATGKFIQPKGGVIQRELPV